MAIRKPHNKKIFRSEEHSMIHTAFQSTYYNLVLTLTPMGRLVKLNTITYSRKLFDLYKTMRGRYKHCMTLKVTLKRYQYIEISKSFDFLSFTISLVFRLIFLRYFTGSHISVLVQRRTNFRLYLWSWNSLRNKSSLPRRCTNSGMS